jgi:hypothetical protein
LASYGSVTVITVAPVEPTSVFVLHVMHSEQQALYDA